MVMPIKQRIVPLLITDHVRATNENLIDLAEIRNVSRPPQGTVTYDILTVLEKGF